MVELAVVIAIGGLLLGYGLSVLTAQLTSTRITTTRDQENVIKTALITFLATNNRFPCPAVENLPDTDANYGVEAATPGTCTGTTDLTGARRGVVPWVSLGLADSAALDGWSRRFTYVVTTSDKLGMAKDCMAAKPMVIYEDDDTVVLASEEVAIRSIFPHESDTFDPYEGEVRVWQR